MPRFSPERVNRESLAGDKWAEENKRREKKPVTPAADREKAAAAGEIEYGRDDPILFFREERVRLEKEKEKAEAEIKNISSYAIRPGDTLAEHAARIEKLIGKQEDQIEEIDKDLDRLKEIYRKTESGDVDGADDYLLEKEVGLEEDLGLLEKKKAELLKNTERIKKEKPEDYNGYERFSEEIAEIVKKKENYINKQRSGGKEPNRFYLKDLDTNISVLESMQLETDFGRVADEVKQVDIKIGKLEEGIDRIRKVRGNLERYAGVKAEKRRRAA
jgi:hypothetical protein